jgi:peptidoglycan/LPS O-acetylase OafA/YrhL
MSPKKVALWFLIVSVALSAALGILALLTGNFGDFEMRIILTTLTISAASIGALASGALWEGRGQKELPLLGIVLSVLAALLIISGIWVEPHSERYWKFTASTGVLAAATTHACLLSLAKLAPRFAWARLVTLTAVYALAVLVVITIYFEPTGDLGFRLIGTVSIVVAALTIMTPIFHRLSRDDFSDAGSKAPVSGRGLWATVSCPRCGTTQPNSLTETTCDRCGCRFVVKILAEGSRP